MSDTNKALQPQKMAKGLNFRILEEGLYYLCSENKGADQLRGYRRDIFAKLLLILIKIICCGNLLESPREIATTYYFMEKLLLFVV